MGVISGIWFVADWLQPLRQPNLLAELIPEDEMDEIYKSNGYPEIESITAYLQDNLEIGVTTKSEVINFMGQYAPTTYSLSSYKVDDCYTSESGDDSLFCNILVFRSFRHTVDIYYAMFFEFDSTLVSIESMAYERRFKSYAVNPFLGIAIVVFLLVALGAGWRIRFHRVA
jgi:hypothetical protein